MDWTKRVKFGKREYGLEKENKVWKEKIWI